MARLAGKQNKTVFLIGPMASGKTVVGTCLARQLGTEFLDTDRIICQRFGMTVAEIFASKGEAAFRQYEKETLSECMDRQSAVIATGGGAVVLKETRECIGSRNLKAQGKQAQSVVVYLKTSIAAQLQRLSEQDDRPLLVGTNKQKVLSRLAHERSDYYSSSADLTLLTDHKDPEVLAQEIATFLMTLEL